MCVHCLMSCSTQCSHCFWWSLESNSAHPEMNTHQQFCPPLDSIGLPLVPHQVPCSTSHTLPWTPICAIKTLPSAQPPVHEHLKPHGSPGMFHPHRMVRKDTNLGGVQLPNLGTHHHSWPCIPPLGYLGGLFWL